MSDDDYVYDEESGEWMSGTDLAERRAAMGQVECAIRSVVCSPMVTR